MDGLAKIGRPVVGSARAAPSSASVSASTAAEMAAQPRPRMRGSRSGNGRPERYVTARGSSAGLSERRYSARTRDLLGRPTGRRHDGRPFRSTGASIAPLSSRGRDGIASPSDVRPDGSRPLASPGDRRSTGHSAPPCASQSGGGRALVSRPGTRPTLTRYQTRPMTADEVEQFFRTRLLAPESFAYAIHERTTDRLIGLARRSAPSTPTMARRSSTSPSASAMRGGGAWAPRRRR